MTAAFRLVHFTPNPGRGNRFTVGGLVRDAKGTRAIVPSCSFGASVLGDASSERLLARSLVHLEFHADFRSLAGFGPYFSLGPEQSVAEGDIDRLVSEILTSDRLPPGQPEHERTQGRRETAWRWVQHYGLEQTIHRKFQAGVGDGFFIPANPALDTVSQYVKGSRGLILLEPLVMRPQVKDDIRKVTQRLTTYRQVLAHSDDVSADFSVYGLDLKKDAILEAHRALNSVEIEFVDTTDSVARKSFVQRMKDFSSAPLLRG